MTLIDIYAHECLWALERERVDRANRLRAAIPLPWSGRWAQARIPSPTSALASREPSETRACKTARFFCPWPIREAS